MKPAISAASSLRLWWGRISSSRVPSLVTRHPVREKALQNKVLGSRSSRAALASSFSRHLEAVIEAADAGPEKSGKRSVVVNEGVVWEDPGVAGKEVYNHTAAYIKANVSAKGASTRTPLSRNVVVEMPKERGRG